MAKATKKKDSKPRATEYEKKVSFDGTFEQMIAISVKDAEKRTKSQHMTEKEIKDIINDNFGGKFKTTFKDGTNDFIVFVSDDLSKYVPFSKYKEYTENGNPSGMEVPFEIEKVSSITPA